MDVARSGSIFPYLILWRTFLTTQWVKNLPAAGDTGLIPGLERSLGERNGNPLQYSYLGSPIDRGAWWATVHRVEKKSQTQHSNRDLSSEIPEAAEITTHMNENYRKAEDKEGKEEEREGGREYEGVACTTKPPAS